MSKILIDEAAVRQALETLEQWDDPFYKRGRAITALREAIRQALANEALDKMAENARELGLSYEQPAVKTYCGGKPNYCIPEQPAPAQPLTEEQIQKVRHNIDWTASWSYIDFANACIDAFCAKNGITKGGAA